MRLDHNQSQITRQLLIDRSAAVNGVGQYVAGTYNGDPWPVFATNEPDVPDNCVTVYDTQGTDDIRSSVDGIQEYHPGVQVRVRALDVNVGKRRAELIRAMLEQVYGARVVVDTAHYEVHNYAKIGRVLTIGTEQGTKRIIFTVNATLAVRQL